jgi:amidase
VPDTELAFAGLARQAELVRAGEVSPRELVELYLERIERLDPRLNAFRVVRGERALAEAEQAAKRRESGEEAPLLGVPIAVKDSQDVAGELTTHGTNAVDEPADEDSEMIRRLRAAGAIVIGKTNLPELAFAGFTETETWGVTRNPWNTDRVPGGSSGGSAAAVAAGLVPCATASDGAGSIRIPAACCGLFGLKPQRGRISLAPDAEHWHGLSVNGCESRRVIDTALYLDVVCGATPLDAHSTPPPERPFVEAATTTPGKLRVALSSKPVTAMLPPIVDDRVKHAIADTGEILRSLGHEVTERDPTYGAIGSHVTTLYFRGIRDEGVALPHPERLERRTRGLLRIGGLYPPPAVRRAKRLQRTYAERVNRLFDRHDVLITPTISTAPVEVGRWAGKAALRTVTSMSRYYPFTAQWNFTGNPAAAVPAGFDQDGLPLSVQIIGRPNDEATLFSLAAQIEAERPWAEQRPPAS